ncbi:MAG: helix-turn-helix domain-containing protein [Gammaproteobacteria bacterium]|nr:MAG: helix-turn-helix domain-containing protein [Gammaproteobacteria bacterium]
MSIQKMRLKRGWSQQQLADASGLSARTIQRIESGHAGSVESLKSIAAVFEVHFLTLTETAMKDETTNSQAQEKIAFKRAQRLRAYYLHLLMYLVVNVGCIAINLFTTPDKLWFVGALLFWGLGLIVHTLTIFVFDKYFTGEWELAQVEKHLGRPL